MFETSVANNQIIAYQGTPLEIAGQIAKKFVEQVMTQIMRDVLFGLERDLQPDSYRKLKKEWSQRKEKLNTLPFEMQMEIFEHFINRIKLTELGRVLLPLKKTSKDLRDFAIRCQAYYISRNRLPIKDLGLKSSEQIVNFAGEMGNCLNYLDLSDFNISDNNLEEIVEYCPNLTHAFIEAPCVYGERKGEISDKGLSYLATLSGLKSLSIIGYPALKEGGMHHLTPLTQLTRLNVSECRTDVINLLILTQLTDLNISGNCVWDFHIYRLTPFLHLTHLNIGNCGQITNTSIKYLAQMTQIRNLDINSCEQVNDDGMCYLAKMVQLKKLNVRKCYYITDVGIKPLKVLTHLTNLNVSYCDQLTNSSMKIFRYFKDLKKLSMSGCEKVSDIGIAYLTTLTRLNKLNMSGCGKVSDIGIAYLTVFTQLTNLNIRDCRLTNLAIKHLTALRKLIILNMSNSFAVTDPAMESIATLIHLKRLDISRCHLVTDVGISNLITLTRLEEIKLNYCHHVTMTGVNYLFDRLFLKSFSHEGIYRS